LSLLRFVPLRYRPAGDAHCDSHITVTSREEFFRAQADLCAEFAQQATDPRVKATYELMATAWQKLFELAEKLRAGSDQKKDDEPSE
jgi:hypothetical protein